MPDNRLLGIEPTRDPLVDQVADLAKQVVDQGAKTTAAIGRLDKGLEAFGTVGAAVDRLTSALEENQRFIREIEVRRRRRHEQVTADIREVVEGGGTIIPPAGKPEGE